MLGCLFDELEDGVEKGSSSPSQAVLAPPPAPRGRTNLAGIWNQGNTCFLNTFMQALSLLPEFREAMFRLTPEELGFYEEAKNKRRVIPIELQKLFASLMMEEQQAMSSKMVTDSFGWGNEVVQQHDVQELCTVLLPALIQSLKGTSGENIINRLFDTKIVTKLRCEGCGNTTENEVEDLILILPVEGFKGGLEASLKNLYCSAEKMTGDEQYKCDVCRAHRDAQRMVKLRSLPPVLMISLNRFAYDASTNKQRKVTDNFPFPMELDLSVYTEEADQSDGSQVYELFSVLVHAGSPTHGHYLARVRDIDNLGHWQMTEDVVEDDHQTPVVRSNLVDCETPKQVVATLLSWMLNHSTWVKIGQLSYAISQETGVPWGKQYKRKYGPFPKFLESHPDTFLVEDGVVTLVGRPGCGGSGDWKEITTKADTAQNKNADHSASSPVHSSSDAAKGDGISGGKKQQSPKPKPGHNWFLFNDANVVPMQENELSEDFSGRKSAYLLVYRRKGLPRPPEAEGNPAYGLAPHLLDEIQKRNEELHKEREEYDRKEKARREEEERRKSEVQVELRYHFNYRVVDGLLTPADDSSTDSGVQHSFPLSTSLRQLMDTIFMLGSGHLEEGNFHVHRMRSSNSKTHLYDELKDMEKTLEELSIENGTILFAWDGLQVDGQYVMPGVEAEPLTVQLVQHSPPNAMTYSFPKNTSLSEFRYVVSKLTGIPEMSLRLRFPQIVVHGDEHGTQGDQETLESIHLTDHACVHFDGNNSAAFATDASSSFVLDGPQPLTTENHFYVCIENRCNKESQQSPVLEVPVDEYMTVGDVKLLLMAVHCIQCDSAALYPNSPSRGLQDPYNEEVTLAQAGITANTQLVLDSTKRVVDFQVRGSQPGGSPDTLQIEVKKRLTVEEALLAMAQAAGLEDPYEWHVCASNFLFDKLAVHYDWDEVLDTSCHFLLLEKGRLPPKGHISLAIWLYPTPQPLHLPNQDWTLTIDDLQLNTCDKAPSGERSFVGNVEVHLDSTLSQLQCQVAEMLAQHQPPRHVAPTRLRLRIIEGRQHRLRRVLRDPSCTIRKFKLDNETPLGVQIVSQGAVPRKEEIVVNVRVLNRVTASYEALQEMIWDAIEGTSPAKLRQDVASGLNLPERQLVIAKHFPLEFRWKIIEDAVQTPTKGQGNSSRKKKGGGRGKSNVCHKPYNLGDGDDIGVILSSNEPGLSDVGVKDDDFCTVEDRQELEKRKQEKLKKQEERQGGGGLFFYPGPRRLEVPLKIQVQEYS